MSARKNKRTAEADARADAKAKAKARARSASETDASTDRDGDGDAPDATGASDPLWGRAAFLALLGLSVGMLGIRFYASQVVGFGDSEALYASYAAHPQPAYLDHPALVGIVARAIGEGAIPTPLRAHAVTSLVATLVPWLVFWTARAVRAARGPAALAGLIVAVVPETAVGLFGLTPDLLLAPLWLGVLALAAVAMRAPAGSNRSAAAFLGAGLLAGVACAAKVSGFLLMGALLFTHLSAAFSKAPGLRDDTRARAAVRTVWPWAGLVAGLVVVAPIVWFEAKTGWPMLRHRFVDTQHGAGAGVVIRNLGALLGGQLAYLSPVFAVLAVVVARDLVRQRSRDAVSRLLFFAFAIPIGPLLAMCVWSPVAEPHWIAPALLVLPIHAARRIGEVTLASKRITVIALSVATLLTVIAHVWVLTPASARLLPDSVDPKVDIASELFGWPTAIGAVKEQMATAGTPFDPEGREVVVVGPHWTICAQLHAALPGVRVGCATPVPDDFDTWLPREEWRAAEHVLFVTDNRYPGDGADQLPGHVKEAQSRVRVLRGGKTARIFELYLYDRRAQSSR
jgi:hypothetical protein